MVPPAAAIFFMPFTPASSQPWQMQAQGHQGSRPMANLSNTTFDHRGLIYLMKATFWQRLQALANIPVFRIRRWSKQCVLLGQFKICHSLLCSLFRSTFKLCKNHQDSAQLVSKGCMRRSLKTPSNTWASSTISCKVPKQQVASPSLCGKQSASSRRTLADGLEA